MAQFAASVRRENAYRFCRVSPSAQLRFSVSVALTNNGTLIRSAPAASGNLREFCNRSALHKNAIGKVPVPVALTQPLNGRFERRRSFVSIPFPRPRRMDWIHRHRRYFFASARAHETEYNDLPRRVPTPGCKTRRKAFFDMAAAFGDRRACIPFADAIVESNLCVALTHLRLLAGYFSDVPRARCGIRTNDTSGVCVMA